jgi:hypothetical protein
MVLRLCGWALDTVYELDDGRSWVPGALELGSGKDSAWRELTAAGFPTGQTPLSS